MCRKQIYDKIASKLSLINYYSSLQPKFKCSLISGSLPHKLYADSWCHQAGQSLPFQLSILSTWNIGDMEVSEGWCPAHAILIYSRKLFSPLGSLSTPRGAVHLAPIYCGWLTQYCLRCGTRRNPVKGECTNIAHTAPKIRIKHGLLNLLYYPTTN